MESYALPEAASGLGLLVKRKHVRHNESLGGEMAETAVLLHVRDHKGVLALLDLVGLQLGKALPLAGAESQLMILADEGFWLVSEGEGPRRSFTHALTFVAYSRVASLSVTLSDAARRSDEPWEKIQGMHVVLSYSAAGGTAAEARVEGDLVLESVRSDEDAPRLWALVPELIAKSVGEGCAVEVLVRDNG